MDGMNGESEPRNNRNFKRPCNKSTSQTTNKKLLSNSAYGKIIYRENNGNERTAYASYLNCSSFPLFQIIF